MEEICGGKNVKVSHVSQGPIPSQGMRERGKGGRGRLHRNKEPPADELIFPDDSRGYGPAGV